MIRRSIQFHTGAFLACALIGLVLEGVIAGLLYTKIVRASQAVNDAKATIKLLEQREADFAHTKQELESFDATIQGLQDTFMNDATFVTFLERLEQLAKEAGVVLEAQSAQIASKQNVSEPAKVSFTIKGELASLITFFAALDKVPYSGLVDSISLSVVSPHTKQVSGLVNYNIFNVAP